MSAIPEPPIEILTLGSLSNAPDFFPKEEDGEEASAFFFPVDVFHDAIGMVGMVGTQVAQATSTVVASTAQLLTSNAQLAFAETQNMFPGLAIVRAESTVMAQVVGRAADIAEDFPPIWYVNLPTDVSDWQRRELNERVQAMKDFKCWSSLKWWADVFKEVPTTGDHENKMRQSSAFVRYAAQDLWNLEWFRSNESPMQTSRTIECRMSDLHGEIMDLAFGTFQGLDDISRRALEPVFKKLLNSASEMTIEYQDQRMVLAEKHEFRSSTNSIVSSIRMISFQIGESFYTVQDGKDSYSRMVRCGIEFGQFDAEFDMQRWNNFANSIASDQKRATEDFIFQQTIDMDGNIEREMEMARVKILMDADIEIPI